MSEQSLPPPTAPTAPIAIDVQLTRADALRASRAALRHPANRKLRVRVILWQLVQVASALTALALYRPGHASSWLALIAVAVLVFAVVRLSLTLAEPIAATLSGQLMFAPEGILHAQPGVRTYHEWSRVIGAANTKDLVLIVLPNLRHLVIPKRCVDPATLDRVVETIVRNGGPEAAAQLAVTSISPTAR